MSFRSLVIEASGRRIVVDTATGNAKSRPQIPEFDHVGWNTRLVHDEWVPTFPRARYLFDAREVDYWAGSTDPLHAPAFADSVRPVLEAGLADLVESDTVLTPEVQLRMTPGHTPGHMSVWIGEGAVITGDVLHRPIQCRHPEWTARGDVDPDAARTTRGRLLAAVAATNAPRARHPLHRGRGRSRTRGRGRLPVRTRTAAMIGRAGRRPPPWPDR